MSIFKNTISQVRKLKSGDSVLVLGATKKQSEALFKAALLTKDITVDDLKYQANKRYNKPFKDLLVGAFVKKCLETYLNKSKDEQKEILTKVMDEQKKKVIKRRNKKQTPI